MQWVLDEQAGLNVGSGPILTAFAAQRVRFLRMASALDARQWQSQSRCVGWSVHQLVRHVRDVAAIHVANLAGRPWPFRGMKAFCPASSPIEWLADSEGEPPQQTVAKLTELVEEEARLLRITAKHAPETTRPGPLRRELHWSVRSVHIFWDAWTHERDLSPALAVAPEYGPDEFRLATMYSLRPLPQRGHRTTSRLLSCSGGAPTSGTRSPRRVAACGSHPPLTRRRSSPDRWTKCLTACPGGARNYGSCCRVRRLRWTSWPCCVRWPRDPDQRSSTTAAGQAALAQWGRVETPDYSASISEIGTVSVAVR